MNKGFKILIQKGLHKDVEAEAYQFVDNFIKRTKESLELFYYGVNSGRGGRASYLRRHTKGQLISKTNRLVFRRLYSHSRTFAVMEFENLMYEDGTDLEFNLCHCDSCNTGKYNDTKRKKVKVKPNTYFYEYAMVGDYKG
jgi:hypothetical protein